MSKMKIEEGEKGWYEWTAYTFHPSQAVYRLLIQPKPGVRACAFEYSGSFVQKNGRWVATVPKLVTTALQPGE
jgi:hypothetical protein